MKRRRRFENVEESSSESEDEYVVEKILQMRKRKDKYEFFIKWEGYNDAESTWEPEDHLDCPEKMKEFFSTCAIRSSDKVSSNLYVVKSILAIRVRKDKVEPLINLEFCNDVQRLVAKYCGASSIGEEPVDAKNTKQNAECFIKWEDCNNAPDSWEPKEHLYCPKQIMEFFSRKVIPEPVKCDDNSTKTEDKRRSLAKVAATRAIEEIRDLRQKNGKAEFHVKWKDSSRLTWEVEKYLKCFNFDDKASMFYSYEPQPGEVQPERILEATRDDEGKVFYMMKWKDIYMCDWVLEQKVFENYPEVLFNYYEEKITLRYGCVLSKPVCDSTVDICAGGSSGISSSNINDAVSKTICPTNGFIDDMNGKALSDNQMEKVCSRTFHTDDTIGNDPTEKAAIATVKSDTIKNATVSEVKSNTTESETVTTDISDEKAKASKKERGPSIKHNDSEDDSEYSDDNKEYVVEGIREKRIKDGKTEYFIKWEGYPEEDNTWEPIESMTDCTELLLEFEKRLGRELSRAKGVFLRWQLYNIVGLKVIDGELFCELNWTYHPNEFLSYRGTKLVFPRQLLEFLKKYIEWTKKQPSSTKIESAEKSSAKRARKNH